MGTTVVQLRGGKGLTAAEQAFLAGQIAEPTQAALDAFLRAPALEAAEQAGIDIGDLTTEVGEFVSARSGEIDDKLGEADAKIAETDGVRSSTEAVRTLTDTARIAALNVVSDAAGITAAASRVTALTTAVDRIASPFESAPGDTNPGAVTISAAPASDDPNVLVRTDWQSSDGRRHLWPVTLHDARFEGTPPDGLITAVEVPRVDGNYRWIEASRDDVAFRALSETDGMLNQFGPAYPATGGLLPVMPRIPIAPSYYQYAGPAKNNDGTGRFADFDPAVVDLYLFCGQSLARGQTALTDLPAPADYYTPLTVTPEHPGFGLMPSCGVLPDGRAFSSFVDLYEQFYQPAGGGTPSGETMISRTIGRILDDQLAAFGKRQRTLGIVCATGESTLTNIGRGTAAWSEIIRCVTQASRIAAAMGCRIRLRGIVFEHGESDSGFQYGTDTDPNTGTEMRDYRDRVAVYRAQVEEEARRILAQPERVFMFVSQTNRGSIEKNFVPRVTIAQLTAADIDPLIVCTGQKYHYPQNDVDGIHPNKFGYNQIGDTRGRQIFETIHGKKYQPMRIVEAFQTGPRTIRVRINKPVSLETDDTLIKISNLAGAQGFTINDGTTAPPIVTGCALDPAGGGSILNSRTGPCWLTLTLDSDLTGYRRILQYAQRYTTNRGGSMTSARGGVRGALPWFNAKHSQPASYGPYNYPNPTPLYERLSPDHFVLN